MNPTTMMKTLVSAACWAFTLAALVLKTAPAAAFEPAWSASDPLSIPYAVRLQQFARGNLAVNPSFEDRAFRAAEADRDPEPPGWERVGARVEWLDREAGAVPDEIHHGRRAIRIQRPRAGELDAADGILSGYLPVIPGNYDFTYAVRLQHVAGNRLRFGSRLGDAVSVRLLFFDAERQPIGSAVLNPVGGSLIDASDKSYAFANYWSIDAFEWARVRARTYNYPFSDGDLPDGTRYVRLFLGLKGSGTMWLDSVDFRYSKWNFSALERMQPYIGRPLSALDRLIPAPKKIRPVREVVYVDPASADPRSPLIVLPEDPAPADRSAARLLEEKLNAALGRADSPGGAAGLKARVLAGDVDGAALPPARLVFSIGVNRLSRESASELPRAAADGNPQGYVIHPVDAGAGHRVFLSGATPLANYYAAATAAQLIEADRCVYHSAAVADFPDFLGRSYLLKRWEAPAEVDRDLEGLDLMARLKLNKAYAGHDGRARAWHQPDELYKAGVAAIGRRCRDGGVIALGVMVNPYAHFEFEPSAETLGESARYTWTHSSDASLETLQGLFGLGLDAGAETIMLLADDRVPHEGRNRKNFSLYTAEDRRRFVNLQSAQAHVINRLKAWLDRDHPGVRFEFCPPWYANEFIDRSEGKAEIYLQELAAQIPPEVAVVWTGPTVRSLSLDLADLRRYRNLIGRWPMFWDNTLYARNLETTVYGGYTTHYPGKARLCNLFEPLDVDRPDGFHELNDGRHMYVNAAADSEVYRVKFATVADYEWNTADYVPERSLWKALVSAFGEGCAREILVFNEAYYGLYEMCARLEGRTGDLVEYARRGAAWLERLDASLSSLIRQLPGDHALAGELTAGRDRQKSRFEGLARADRPASP